MLQFYFLLLSITYYDAGSYLFYSVEALTERYVGYTLLCQRGIAASKMTVLRHENLNRRSA